MRSRTLALILLMGVTALLLATSPAVAKKNILVAPPTGDRDTDQASVLAAIDQAMPGDFIRFAPGTYVIGGELPIIVDVPDVSLIGHPEGTTLRGGDLSTFDELGIYEGLWLTAGGQTVQDLTFEAFSWDAIVLGELYVPAGGRGGYTVQGCTFESLHWGVYGFGNFEELSTIRNNRFVNVLFAYGFEGGPFRFSQNTVIIDDLAAIPLFERPYNVGWTIPNADFGVTCEANVFDNNTVIGNVDGFIVYCDDVIIRDNNVFGQRVLPDEPGGSSTGDLGTLAWIVGADGVRVVGNTLDGSEGVGIVTAWSTNTTIADNVIKNLTGTDLVTLAEPYNGAGVFLDIGSDYNLVKVNTYENNVGPEVLCYGDNNSIIFGSPDDEVVDTGINNEVRLDY